MRSPTLVLAALLTTAPWLVVSGCPATQRPDGESGLLPEGSPVPELSAPAHDGSVVELRALERPTIIYFYPKDATPGCTKEACAFRDAWSRYQDAGVGVVGVSTDSLESHQAFAREHELPFPLVSDAEASWARSFGVSMTAGMTRRVSFLVHGGKVAKVYPGVDPGVHADEVLRDAQDLMRP